MGSSEGLKLAEAPLELDFRYAATSSRVVFNPYSDF